MKFNYKKIPLVPRSLYLGTSALRPIIPITIIYKNKPIRYDTLIDSGADFCILPAELGDYIGIPINSGIKQFFGGIQEQKRAHEAPVAYMHDITLEIGGYKYKTVVGFSYDIAKRGYGILGQKGFFNLFNVQFDYRKEEIELKEKTEIN